jgi:hypothetical protein
VVNGVPEAFGTLVLALSSKADVYERSYLKFQDFLAQIRGMVHFVYILAKIIVRYFSSKSLLLEYINHRSVDLKSDERVDIMDNNHSVVSSILRTNNYTKVVPQHR